MKSYIRVQICHWVFYCPLHKVVENGGTLLSPHHHCQHDYQQLQIPSCLFNYFFGSLQCQTEMCSQNKHIWGKITFWDLNMLCRTHCQTYKASGHEARKAECGLSPFLFHASHCEAHNQAGLATTDQEGSCKMRPIYKLVASSKPLL